MGSQSVLRALREVTVSGEQAPVRPFGEIMLVASDLDSQDALEILPRIRNLAQGITLYVSRTDQVLKSSRAVHSGLARAGDIGPTGPLIVAGVDTIDVSLASTDYFSLGHSSYRQNTGLLNDVSLLIRSGVRPPHLRYANMTVRKGDKGIYWVYTP
jgi:esterase/lipase superfamily enzyme